MITSLHKQIIIIQARVKHIYIYIYIYICVLIFLRTIYMCGLFIIGHAQHFFFVFFLMDRACLR